MEKEKLSEQLRGYVGETSLSDRTWNDYLDNSVMPFIPTEEDKVEDFLNRHANALKSINGQLNNEVATKVNDFKKNYKPEPIKPDTEPKPQDDKLKEIESRLQKFEQAESAKQEAAFKSDVLEATKKLMKKEGSTNDTILNLILPQLTISKETTAQELATIGKEMYDKAYSDLYGDSYVPSFNQGFNNGSKKADKDAYRKHLIETGRITE